MKALLVKAKMAMVLAATFILGCNEKTEKPTAPAAAPKSAVSAPENAKAKVASEGSAVAKAEVPAVAKAEVPAVAKAEVPAAANAEVPAIAPDAGARDAPGSADSAATEPQADDDDPATPSRAPERFFDKFTEPAMATGDKRLAPMKAKLEEELEMPVRLLRPIALGDSVYTLYEHERRDAELLERNPNCHGYGLARARFESGDKEQELSEVESLPLEVSGCDLKIRHWFVGERGLSQRDVVLEVVSSHVIEGGTISRQQLLVLWDPTRSEKKYSRELASWTVEPGDLASEPPAIDSFLLHGFSYGHRIAVVHLLPCYPPWGERSCALEVRKRTYELYGEF
jgi:hypothetical protein